MTDPFIRYLLAKQSVDDRALNRSVYEALIAHLPAGPIRIIEVGAGIGTMIARLLRWNALRQAEYLAIDARPENVEYARVWLPAWAERAGLGVERSAEQIRLFDAQRQVWVRFLAADVFDVIRQSPPPADLLIAHAVLDLLPLPESLSPLLSLTHHLAWFTLNFDGITAFEPPLDPALDAQIERLYHRTMDTRPGGGDSRCGRHLLGYLLSLGVEMLAAGPSDWIISPSHGAYPEDEAFFLQAILNFVEDSLRYEPELDQAAFARWLGLRRQQVQEGKLIYVAHQVDVLVQAAAHQSIAG